MIVTCPNCTTRLQLDDAKIPARPFSVRCPKCQLIISAEQPAEQKKGGALDAVGGLPSSMRAPQETSITPTPVLNAEPQKETSDASRTGTSSSPAAAGDGELMHMLSSLLQRALGEDAGVKGAMVEAAGARRSVWDNRRMLVCIGAAHRDAIVNALTANGHRVIVAEDAMRALEHMREEKVDVLLLDPDFDKSGQGAATITRELNAMRMADRRRLVLVQLSPTARTGDVHAAFVNNVNLIVNKTDAASLPQLLEKNVRELNDLYRDFNKALNLSAL